MMSIRAFIPSDFDRLYQIDQESFPPEIAYSYLELQYYVRSPNCRTLIAEDKTETRRAGIVGFVIGVWEPPDLGHIITIDVLPHKQRQKIGSRLLTRIEQWLWEKGAEAIYLEASVDDSAALSFYDKHGYFILDRLEGYYAREHDAFVLMKTDKR
jgi:ribosomal-protein-alanine N-acetyltransferase